MPRYIHYPKTPFPPSPSPYPDDPRPAHLCTIDPATPLKTCPIPQRQIRAHFDAETVTLYQAYSADIAAAAVAAQKLDASPKFKIERMTWIKPSFTWVMYRSGYAAKPNQERILAIKMRHEHFAELLSRGVPTDQMTKLSDCANKHSVRLAVRTRSTDVHIQWDPERTVKLDKLPIRCIQIGIPGCLVQQWVDEWIVSIQDVTDAVHKITEETAFWPTLSPDVWLYRQGWLPWEEPYDHKLSRATRRRIGMEDED